MDEKKRRRCANQRGVGIMEVVIAAGLMGVLALVSLKIADKNFSFKKHINHQDLSLMMAKMIELSLLKDQVCEQSIAGLDPREDGDDIQQIEDAENQFRPGQLFDGGKLELTTMRIKNYDATKQLAIVQIIFQTRRIGEAKAGDLARQFNFQFPLAVTLQGGTVQNCFGFRNEHIRAAAVETCRVLGGVVDDRRVQMVQQGNTYYDVAECILMPNNAIVAFHQDSCPDGWREANGSGGTPDLRDEFVRGMQNSGQLRQTETDSYRNHTHRFEDEYYEYELEEEEDTVESTDFACGIVGSDQVAEAATLRRGNSEVSRDSDGTVLYSSSPDNDSGTETRPDSVLLTYCMKE